MRNCATQNNYRVFNMFTGCLMFKNLGNTSQQKTESKLQLVGVMAFGLFSTYCSINIFLVSHYFNEPIRHYLGDRQTSHTNC